jgi:hypothetical protein
MNKYLKTYIRNRDITLSDNRKLNSDKLGIKHYEMNYTDVDVRDIQRDKIPEIILNKDVLEKYFLNQTVYKNIQDYKFTNHELTYILRTRPEYIKYLINNLNVLKKNDIIFILFYKPNLYKYFNFDNFNEDDFDDMVSHSVGMKDHWVLLKEFHNKINFYRISNYIKKYPDNYIHFIDILKERGLDDIDDLIFWQPKILEYMNPDDVHNLRYRDVEEIIQRFPEMKNYFEKIGYL